MISSAHELCGPRKGYLDSVAGLLESNEIQFLFWAAAVAAECRPSPPSSSSSCSSIDPVGLEFPSAVDGRRHNNATKRAASGPARSKLLTAASNSWLISLSQLVMLI